jgi:citrate/tricarballylate utilization protein
MHATSSLAEADRIMTVCNSCRYCEGLCAVFPAMERRRTFADGDLNYLANLCHGCGACFYDCQFSPPHEFQVNVPHTLARVRAESYGRYAWPAAFSPFFSRNGRAILVTGAIGVALFLVGFAIADHASVLVRHSGPGAFYTLMPHGVMVFLFGISFVAALTALGAGLAKFVRDIDEPATVLLERASLLQAGKDTARLRYLEGGGGGCMNEDERPTDRRALFHHVTFYGFLLCFLATCVATLYHYGFGREAPYPWYDLPVLLGSAGGLGLIVGPAGLFVAKFRRAADLRDGKSFGMDSAFIAMLFLTGLSGLALLFLRATAAMGPLLAIHLGVVLALFLTLPYGKFVHGVYRFAALVRYARECHADSRAGNA